MVLVPSPITLCGSISRLASPLGRSMHEAAYRALGVPFTYVPFEIRDLKDTIRGMRALGIRGFGVSHPFKTAVMPLLDELDPVAERIGAVNTIVNTDARLVGHNTDWSGAVLALEEVRPLGEANAIVLGAGGAARAVVFGLKQRGARVTVANRTPSKAETLARDAGARAVAWDETERLFDYDIVINATTLGQHGEGAGPPFESLRPHQLVMDLVYKPIRTAFLAEARARGATTLHGGRMLLHQAGAQFELYTLRPPPLDVMDQALCDAIGQ